MGEVPGHGPKRIQRCGPRPRAFDRAQHGAAGRRVDPGKQRFQGITTRETIDLIGIAVANGDITAAKAFSMMEAITHEGRVMRLPASAEELQR